MAKYCWFVSLFLSGHPGFKSRHWMNSPAFCKIKIDLNGRCWISIRSKKEALKEKANFYSCFNKVTNVKEKNPIPIQKVQGGHPY